MNESWMLLVLAEDDEAPLIAAVIHPMPIQEIAQPLVRALVSRGERVIPKVRLLDPVGDSILQLMACTADGWV
jgi:hypothetical protein